jgi:hypothetical protein
MKIVRALVVALIITGGALGLTLGFFSWCQLPNHDYSLKVAPLDGEGSMLQALLQNHVWKLANQIGYRNLDKAPVALASAAAYITEEMAGAGYEIQRHTYKIGDQEAVNLHATLAGADQNHLLVIGAHYDSFDLSPGADDNASGVAMLIELARKFRDYSPAVPVMFVFFTCEEEPFYETRDMGSYRFVEEVLKNQPASYRMINLESVGYYTHLSDSQVYPFPLNLLYYPIGDFIGFVSDLGSRGFLMELVHGFRANSNFPTGASSLPSFLPGVEWSDHAAFWRAGRSAVMVTDSALFRNPYYHSRHDRAELLDYQAMAHVTQGLAATIKAMTAGKHRP